MCVLCLCVLWLCAVPVCCRCCVSVAHAAGVSLGGGSRYLIRAKQEESCVIRAIQAKPKPSLENLYPFCMKNSGMVV